MSIKTRLLTGSPVLRAVPVLLVLLIVSACGRVDLYEGLDESSSAEILVLLDRFQIEARKEKVVAGQEVSWKVTVDKGDGPRAREILVSHKLPRREALGLSGVYKEKGLIPTPDEQKARFLLALKGEIINSLEKIPGVIEADVVLNVPTESEFAELSPEKKRPTASVIVRTKDDPEVAVVVTEGKIQRFVANSVQELDPNDVTVIVTRTKASGLPEGALGGVAPPPVGDLEEGIPPLETGEELTDLAGLHLTPGSVGRFKTYMISLLALLVLVSTALLLSIVRLNRLKLRLQTGGAVQALEGGEAGFLGPGQGGAGVEGTFDVNARRQG